MENIKIEMLYAHPQNPRQDVGDVTELADSIKVNGVFQNLTVIKGGPGVPSGVDGYTVIIGHRRMAAAKQAGLEELPCSVVEMDEKEQLATMLLENMQRTDLTTYEQAQGFQMMLDLGETQQSISEKTGFSAKTVNNRLKLLNLDKKKFQEAEARGGTLEQYIKVAAIKDEDTRNKVLAAIGTNDFMWKMTEALRSEKIAEKLPGAKKELMQQGTKGQDAWRWNCDYHVERKCSIEEWEPGVFEVDKDPKETYYWLICGNVGYVLRKIKKQKAKPVKKSEKEIEAIRRREALVELFNKAYEQRLNFIMNFKGGKDYENIANDWLVRAVAYSNTNTIGYMWLDTRTIKESIGQDESCYYIDRELFDVAYSNNKVKMIASVAYAHCNDGKNEMTAALNGGEMMPGFNKNNKLDFIYEYLTQLGYEISSEEENLLNGTHELFRGGK